MPDTAQLAILIRDINYNNFNVDEAALFSFFSIALFCTTFKWYPKNEQNRRVCIKQTEVSQNYTNGYLKYY